jgi:hypothetical protein
VLIVRCTYRTSGSKCVTLGIYWQLICMRSFSASKPTAHIDLLDEFQHQVIIPGWKGCTTCLCSRSIIFSKTVILLIISQGFLNTECLSGIVHVNWKGFSHTNMKNYQYMFTQTSTGSTSAECFLPKSQVNLTCNQQYHRDCQIWSSGLLITPAIKNKTHYDAHLS